MRWLTRETRLIGASVVVAAAGAAASLFAVQGCTLKNCDPSFTNVRAPGAAVAADDPTPVLFLDSMRKVDETTWESGPIDGQYLDFPGQRTYTFFTSDFADPSKDLPAPYVTITPYVSVDPNPMASGSNFTVASGNLAEITAINNTNSAFNVWNNTCAPYYLRVVVTRAMPDAGAPAPVDASTDAEIDAPSDVTDAGAD